MSHHLHAAPMHGLHACMHGHHVHGTRRQHGCHACARMADVALLMHCGHDGAGRYHLDVRSTCIGVSATCTQGARTP